MEERLLLILITTGLITHRSSIPSLDSLIFHFFKASPYNPSAYHPKMKTITLINTLLVTSALSLPNNLQTRTWTDTELCLNVHNVGFQGDGFYLAIFDDDGASEVKFTPMGELPDLNSTDSIVDVLPASDISARGAGIVKARPDM